MDAKTVKESVLLRLFESYRGTSLEQSEVVDAFIELVKHSARAAYRDNFVPGHLTGSAWIRNHTGTQVLLLHHAKLSRWLQPGGHADGEYDLAAVALREASEETGLTSLAIAEHSIFDIDIHTIPARGNEPQHKHFDVRFLLVADESEQLRRNHESREIAWFPIATIQSVTSEDSILRMRDKT